MAFSLSLALQGSLQRTFDEPPYPGSRSGSPDHSSTGTVKRHNSRDAVRSSNSSFSATKQGPYDMGNENTPPRQSLRSFQQTYLATQDKVTPCRTPGDFVNVYARQQVDCDSDSHTPEFVIADKEESHHDNTTSYFSCNAPLSETTLELVTTNPSEHKPPVKDDCHAQPFKRWMSTLKRRNFERGKRSKATRTQYLTPQPTRWDLDDPGELFRSPVQGRTDPKHRRSISWSSSLGFVTAIKSATMTLASFTTAPRSRYGGHYGNSRAGNRSSRISSGEVRKSFDSGAPSLDPIIEQRALDRAMERRRILEELILTEQAFVADLKIFLNVSLYSSAGTVINKFSYICRCWWEYELHRSKHSRLLPTP